MVFRSYYSFLQICEKRLAEHWIRNWEPQQQAPYLVLGNRWISYDDIESLTLKSQFVKDLGLAGAMVWSIETDDFLGICGNGRYPLLTVINSVVRQEASATTNLPSATDATTTNLPSTTDATTTKAPSESFVCLSDGVFRDSENCAAFYMCIGVNMYEFTCPNGLLFDLNSKTCNWPSEVDC